MGEDFRLKWNDHHTVFFSTAESLCNGDHLTDITLSCGDQEFSAHKLVLSICSTYFKNLFTPKPMSKRRPADSAAIVYLKDVDPRHMELLLHYMYRGEINVEEAELMDLLATAKGLQIKGLTDGPDDNGGQTQAPRPAKPPVAKKRPAAPASKQSAVIPAPKKIKEEDGGEVADETSATDVIHPEADSLNEEADLGDQYLEEGGEYDDDGAYDDGGGATDNTVSAIFCSILVF